MLRKPSLLRTLPLFTIAAGSLLAGCSGGGGGSGVANFDPKRVANATAAASPLVIEGKWLVYLASEALSAVGGTNFNAGTGDGDTNDDCAVVVDMTTKAEVDLGVATLEAKIVGDQIYLMVAETADSKDWNLDADTNDRVLLHYSKTSPLSFVDEIDSGNNAWAVVDGRLYYVSDDTAGLVNGDTSLNYLETSAPTTPVVVLHSDAANTLEPEILGVDEDLIFLIADETSEGRDLNGDGDSLDPYVLALLDGTNLAGVIQNVGLSIEDDSSPFSARSTGAGDWLVGFLVDEATQSDAASGLNDPISQGFGNNWKPTNCAGYADVDQTDHVLHVIESYAAWSAAPLVAPPENTGLPGNDRVLTTTTAAATLVDEADEGGGACDLNNDGDFTDTILRWVIASAPQAPFGTATQMNAVEDSLPGGTDGASDLSNKWICVVSESDDNTDHDGDAATTHNLVAWLDPAAGSPVWVFDTNPSSAGLQPAGASWMADRPARDRLLVAYQEAVINLAINTGDNDKLDSVPTFVRFDPANPNDLDFPGPAAAVAATNPGIAIATKYAFYRLDENADNRDWNGDNVKDDFILFRTDVNTGFSALIGLANNLTGPIVVNSGSLGAAFLADETMAGADLNNDGRSDGFVVTWFRIGS